MTAPDEALERLAAALRAAGTTLGKGHGAGNDFLILVDPDGRFEVTAEQVVAVTDRRAGIGADGLIRALPSSLGSEGAVALASEARAQWFMDYRNADGSVAQTCGNGLRVLVEFLSRRGLVPDSPGSEVVVGTRAGTVTVRREPDGLVADLGRWWFPGGVEATDAGYDVGVAVAGLAGLRPGLRVAVANPHTVVAVADRAELERADLGRPPLTDPVAPAGTNVELVVPLGERVERGERVGLLAMRVHERGVGETRSCGSGACAAALAVRAWAGGAAPDRWEVSAPGGDLRVRVLPEQRVELGGPARIVGTVELS